MDRGAGNTVGIPASTSLPVLEGELPSTVVTRAHRGRVGPKVVETNDLARGDGAGGTERHDTAVMELEAFNGAVGGLPTGVVNETAQAPTAPSIDNVQRFLGARFLILHGVRVCSKTLNAFTREALGLGDHFAAVRGDDDPRRDWLHSEEELALVGALADFAERVVLLFHGPIRTGGVAAGFRRANHPPVVGASGSRAALVVWRLGEVQPAIAGISRGKGRRGRFVEDVVGELEVRFHIRKGPPAGPEPSEGHTVGWRGFPGQSGGSVLSGPGKRSSWWHFGIPSTGNDGGGFRRGGPFRGRLGPA